MRYTGFHKEGLEVVAAFDANPESARTRVTSVPVLSDEELDGFVTEHSIKLAILCVPAEFAQAIANRLVAAGVQGMLDALFKPDKELPQPVRTGVISGLTPRGGLRLK